MPGPAVVAVGGFGIEQARRAKSWGAPVLAIAEVVAAGAASGPEVTRTLRDFASVELPPFPAEESLPPLEPSELLAPPRASAPALEAGLAAAIATGVRWLPPAVSSAPQAWLRALGDPPAIDRLGLRLLWPRLEKAFAAALLGMLGRSNRRLWIVADGAEPLSSGLLVDLIAAARGEAESVTVVLAPPPAAGSERLEALLLDLETLGEDGHPLPILMLAPGFEPGAMALLFVVSAADFALEPKATYRARPLVFGRAFGACLRVAPSGARWQVSAHAARGALARLLLRPPTASSGGVATSRELLEQMPLPAFAREAGKPLHEQLRERKVAPFPAAATGDDLEAHRKRLDGLFHRREREIADRRARHEEESKDWLYGGKLSRLGHATSPGFLALVSRAVIQKVAGEGIDVARAFLSTLTSELRTHGAGAPRVQLGGRIAELERARGAFQTTSRGSPLTLAGLLGRRETGAREEGERHLTEYARLLADLLRVQEIDALFEAGHELWDQCLAPIGPIDGELLGLKTAAAAAADAIDAVRRDRPLPESAVAAIAAEAGHTPEALLSRLLVDGATRRWASSPQDLLDELWNAARVPLSGAALLGRLDQPGKRLREAFERMAPGAGLDHVPGRLQPRPSYYLRAPSADLLSGTADELHFPVESALAPGGDALVLLKLEVGLPVFALPAAAAAGARSPRSSGYDELLGATLGAPDLAAVALVDRGFAAAEGLREPGNSAEIDLLLRLHPLAEALRKGSEVSDAADRIHYLEQARHLLESWAREALDGLVEPELAQAAAAAARWREELAVQLGACRGRAEVRLGLRTRRLAHLASSLAIEVEVVSCGSVPAEEVAVTIEPASGYRVLGEGKVGLGRLPPGAAASACFRIKPSGPGKLQVSFLARFDDRVGQGNETRLDEQAEVFEVRQGFRRIASNPFVAGPPVKSDRMFFGREDTFSFLRDNLRGRYQNNVLILHGNRRTGKSSILYQLERGEHVAPAVPVYLDLQGLGRLTTGSLFHALAKKTARALAGRGLDPPEPPAREALDGEAAFEVMNEWIDDLTHGPAAAAHVLFLIDEFELLEDKAREGRLDPEVFGWLRSLMQHRENLGFVLAGTHRLSEMDETLWAPLHAIALYRHVGFLGEAEARRLVVEPVEGEIDFDDLALESILRLTAAHPYYVQLLCQLLVNGVNQKAVSNVVTVDDVNAAAENALDAGAGQFAYEWGVLRHPQGRPLLRALASAADAASVWVDLDDLARRAGLPLPVAEESAREAVARDLVLHSGGAYRVRMDLFRLWLRREAPAVPRPPSGLEGA